MDQVPDAEVGNLMMCLKSFIESIEHLISFVRPKSVATLEQFGADAFPLKSLADERMAETPHWT